MEHTTLIDVHTMDEWNTHVHEMTRYKHVVVRTYIPIIIDAIPDNVDTFSIRTLHYCTFTENVRVNKFLSFGIQQDISKTTYNDAYIMFQENPYEDIESDAVVTFDIDCINNTIECNSLSLYNFRIIPYKIRSKIITFSNCLFWNNCLPIIENTTDFILFSDSTKNTPEKQIYLYLSNIPTTLRRIRFSPNYNLQQQSKIDLAVVRSKYNQYVDININTTITDPTFNRNIRDFSKTVNQLKLTEIPSNLIKSFTTNYLPTPGQKRSDKQSFLGGGRKKRRTRRNRKKTGHYLRKNKG